MDWDDAQDDPLSGLFAEVSARLSSPGCAAAGAEYGAYLPAGTRWLALYSAAGRGNPPREPAARALVAPLVDHLCSEAGAVVATSLQDPAAPWLESACWGLLQELTGLAAVFLTAAPGGVCPDPADEYAEEYRRAAKAVSDVLRTTDRQGPLWRMLRAARASARGRPPPARPPRAPLADDREYYL